MGINPFTKKEVFHKGMDIAAPRGTNIYASKVKL
jgi:murein DD-endopeptidase MepM/ murein hydrolase activator NlpD